MNGSKPQPAAVISRPPEVSFSTRQVAPPSPLYITRDEQFLVRIWNSNVGETVRVAGRIMLPGGEITPFQRDFTPLSDRSRSDFSMAVGEGYLLGLTVNTQAGTGLRGQCYVLILLHAGPLGPGVARAVLFSDYLSRSQHEGWPHSPLLGQLEGRGFLRAITGTDPAAGAEISETVPTNARWRVLGVTATLVTAVAAANRQISMAFDDGASVYARMPFTAVQPASLTTVYSWSAAGDPASASNVARSMPLNATPYLFQAHRVRTVTDLLQAADNWSAPVFLVEEWIEE